MKKCGLMGVVICVIGCYGCGCGDIVFCDLGCVFRGGRGDEFVEGYGGVGGVCGIGDYGVVYYVGEYL